MAALLTEAHDRDSILAHQFQRIKIELILLTGLFATEGNAIGFITIGYTGPVRFHVISHTKTILSFIFGPLLFPPKFAESQPQKEKKISGPVVSMVGVIMYPHFELKIREQEKIDTIKQDHKPDHVLADRAPGAIFRAGEKANE
jgi:hypothetical protein